MERFLPSHHSPGSLSNQPCWPYRLDSTHATTPLDLLVEVSTVVAILADEDSPDHHQEEPVQPRHVQFLFSWAAQTFVYTASYYYLPLAR